MTNLKQINMDIYKKFEVYRELFNRDFLPYPTLSDSIKVPGAMIPFESIDYVNGVPVSGYMGDGTINIAHFLTYSRVTKDSYLEISLFNTLYRLQRAAGTICGFDKIHEGFFIRDDFPVETFNRFPVMTATGNFLGIREDVCHGTFESMDQIWNLMPTAGKTIFMKSCVQNLLSNGGILYNPYFSEIYNRWTYCNLKIHNLKDRISDREKAPMKVRVKRGAYNPHLLWGFISLYKTLYDEPAKIKHKWFYKLLHFTVVGLAEFLIYPLFKKWVPVKNNSWHCFYVASEKKGWFGNRMMKKFNESLKRKDKTPEFWNLAVIYDQKKIDFKALKEWLEWYPEPNTSWNSLSTPLVYMTLYQTFTNLKSIS